MDSYTRSNRALWETWTALHETSAFYDIPGFKTGRAGLTPLEIEEVGPVNGRSLLHLQCHFGLGSLTWVRRGARVTGVDFGDKAIALAQSLSAELNLPATFICTDIYELTEVLEGEFDIVFTSFGVLPWLSDLEAWAALIAYYLKPGGFFYIVEFHPILQIFADGAERVADLRVEHPYFYDPQPTRWEVSGSYAVPEAEVPTTQAYEWAHSLGEIVNALLQAGLQIEFLHEFPFCAEQMLACLEEGVDGWWRLPEHQDSLPLMFSLRARKPEAVR